MKHVDDNKGLKRTSPETVSRDKADPFPTIGLMVHHFPTPYHTGPDIVMFKDVTTRTILLFYI